MKKCEQHVADHKAYDVTYASAAQYAADARAKYAACETLSSCLEDLQTRQTVVQVGNCHVARHMAVNGLTTLAIHTAHNCDSGVAA